MFSVRLLHTSDWHLGRLFHGASLLDEQRLAMARIVEIVQERSVDVVLIAGDLYDRSVPPADAVELFDSTLHDLHATGAAVVAISGNHDSAVRVGYGDRLLERLRITVRGAADRVGTAVVLTPRDGGVPVRVYPIPYLDPLATAHLALADRQGAAGDDSGRRARFTHHDAMAWAMGRVRADLAGAGSSRSVVVAHTFVTGGDPSASERDLSIGHVDQVGMSVLDGVDYVALGHLHRRQSFDGGRVAYSGTPLPYSFSEQDDIKSVRLVDLTEDGSLQVEQIELGVGRALRTVRGTLDDLLELPEFEQATPARVRAVLTDRVLPLNAMRRLQHRFPHAVELSHEPPDVATVRRGAGTSADVRSSDPIDLAMDFLEDRRGVAATETERRLVADSLQALQREGAA